MMQPTTLTLQLTHGHLPPADRVVLATQRFRGAALAVAMRQLCPELERPQFEDLSPEMRDLLSGLTGKDANGEPTAGNRHLALLPFDDGANQRIVAFKRGGFEELERIALLGASRRLVRWGPADDECFSCVPLPGVGDDIAPLLGPSRIWQSHTPFVPPPHRHRFRKTGKPRPGESPERQIVLLCEKMGFPPPATVALSPDTCAVLLHRTWEQRQLPYEERGAARWPGFWVRLTFGEPVTGPLFLGHSCHFGLGLFAIAD